MAVRAICAVVILMACFNITACGAEWFPDAEKSSSTNNTSNISNQSQTGSSFQTFNFTATVDLINGTPSFGVAIGDKLTGKFVYETNAQDWNTADNNQGYFHDMKSPSGIEFKINTLNFVSALDSYSVTIQNDIISPTLRDTFDIYAKSSPDAKVSISFSLWDFTAAAFSTSTCNALPQILDLQSFNTKEMFITDNSTPGSSYWNIRLRIESLTKG